MRCPHCGFHHLEPKERCLRCRQPMAGGLDTPPEEQSQGLGTGESFTFSRPPEPEAPAPPVEIALTRGSDEDSVLAEDTSASVELVIEREAASEAKEAEDASAADDDGSEVTESAPDLVPAADRTDDTGDEAAPEEREAPAGDESEETDGLSVGPEAQAAEQSADSLAVSALDEVEQALKAVEPAADPAEAEIVAALAQEITPAPTAPAEHEAAGLDAWKEAELLLRAAEARDQEREDDGPAAAEPGEDSASSTGEIDPLILPGDVTAAAVRRFMETEAEATAESDASAEAQTPAAMPAAAESGESSSAPPPESSGASTGPGFTESRLDKFFEQSADDAVAAPPEDDEESQIEIAPRGEDHGPLPLELPLGDAGASSSEHGPAENLRGLRPVRGRRARRAARPGTWLLNLRRAGAGLFDVAVWAALGLLLYKGAVVFNHGTLHGSAGEWLYLVAFPLMIMSGILALVYGSLFGSITGRTPGMMIFGLRLASLDGQKPPLARSFLRTGILILSLVPAGAGLLFALIGDKGALHDRLSGIRVERA